MKVAMLNILGNIPVRLNSHNAGWTFCLASIIEDRCGVYPDFIIDTIVDNYIIIVFNVFSVIYKIRIYSASIFYNTS